MVVVEMKKMMIMLMFQVMRGSVRPVNFTLPFIFLFPNIFCIGREDPILKTKGDLCVTGQIRIRNTGGYICILCVQNSKYSIVRFELSIDGAVYFQTTRSMIVYIITVGTMFYYTT